jgi:hypothetical protein
VRQQGNGSTRGVGWSRGSLAALVLAVLVLSGTAAPAPAAPPTVTIDPDPTPSYQAAAVSGTVDPADQPTLYEFQYSLNDLTWSSAGLKGPLAAGTGPTEVTANITGLVPNTQYFLRLVARDFAGPKVASPGPDPLFTTLATLPPGVSIEDPTVSSGLAARFSGAINPGGTDPAFDVSWYFDCNPACPGLKGQIAADNSTHRVAVDAKLQPNATYEVSLVAENAGQVAVAGPKAFLATMAVPPTALTGDAVIAPASASASAATLHGTVNPLGATTTYHFEYGTTTAYGSRVPAGRDAPLGAGYASIKVAEALAGLQPATTYHYRLVAENRAGSAAGEDRTFTTTSSRSRFAPKLHAAGATPAAGGSSPFTVQVTRDDGEQNISRIAATLPAGLLVRLAGIPLCAAAQAATGACPAASQVGAVTVGIGGLQPLYLPAPGKQPTRVYLAGPYGEDPYSMVIAIPAQVGIFDLGTITVRAGIQIDPATAQVTVESDPLPQVFEGIPIDYRDFKIEVTRPALVVDPTSCEQKEFTSTLVSDAGRTANPSAGFRATSCRRLGFEPRLSMRFIGPTHRSAHPRLRTTLVARKGDANVARAAVTLPGTEFLDNSHIASICTGPQFAAGKCPAGSIYGYAQAWSPLLDQPLRGPVYLRSSSRRLPDLAVSLDGGLRVDLAARTDAVGARIRSTFDFVPDVPVDKFVLTLWGGKRGLLVNNTELCGSAPRGRARFTAHNGKSEEVDPVAATDCRLR